MTEFRLHPFTYNESVLKIGFVMERLANGYVTLRKINLTTFDPTSGNFIRSREDEIHLFVFEPVAKNKLFEWFRIEDIDPVIIKSRLRDTTRDTNAFD